MKLNKAEKKVKRLFKEYNDNHFKVFDSLVKMFEEKKIPPEYINAFDRFRK